MTAIAYAGAGDVDTATSTFKGAVGEWTPADKYRRAFYDLLDEQGAPGAVALRTLWQKVLKKHPEAARPWG